MQNKANKNTEVKYISAEQAADLYTKLETYIAEELDILERMLLSEINETLSNWLEINDLEKFNQLKNPQNIEKK